MGRIKKYKMMPISKKFSEKGGFTAQFVGDGYSIDAVKDILPRIIAETGVKIGNGAAWDLISSFVKACAKHTSETGETVTVGSLLTFGLSIRGWYANQDSRADRDNVRVTASLLGDLRPAIEFSMSNDIEGVKLKVNTVRGATCALGHVKAGETFQLNGIGLNLIEGDTVTAFATTPDGETVEGVCTVTSSAEDRLDAILPDAFAAPSLVGRNVTITVTSHCGDAAATPADKSISAMIDASAAPAPEPTPAGPTVTAINDGTFYPSSGNIVTGENMRFAADVPGAHVTVTDAEGHDAGARVITDAEVPVTDSRFGLVVEGDLTDGAEYVFAFDMLDAAGNPVTVTKAARFSAS